MKLTIAVMPWHVVTAPNGAASVLSEALRPEHEASVYYGSIRFAERMLAAGWVTESAGTAPGFDPEAYVLIAEDGYPSGLGELFFTGALYDAPALPDQVPGACATIGLPETAAEEIFRLATEFADEAARDILAGQPDVVGFTTTFCQTVASLAVARRLKQLRPGLPIVFGGSNCDEVMGETLHRNFSEIDFVVRREGERPLAALLAALAGNDEAAFALIPGLCWRDAAGTAQVNPETSLLPAGAQFPPMDQSAYFAALEESPIAEYIQPTLIMETARGCWWGERKHCTFCGLSDLIMPFRSKSAPSVVDELTRAVGRHQVLDILTTDNILDEGYFDTVLPALERTGLDLRIMYEIKSNITADQARRLRAAGIVQVQPGIENLHSLPLKLMRKGTTGVNNVAALRNLQEQGITALWNYLIGFPGETDESYEEVIAQIPALFHLQPPSGAHRIALERFNPYFEDPGLGFPERTPRAWYSDAFPGFSDHDLADVAYLFDTPNAGVGTATIGRLKEAILQWRDVYPRSALTHRTLDGSLFLYDRRANRQPVDYEIDDPMEITAYESLAKGRSPDQLSKRLNDQGWSTGPQWAEKFVAQLADLGLVFIESGRAVTLSTAFDVTQRRGQAASMPIVMELTS